MSVFLAYILKPFILVAVLLFAYFLGWPIRKWLHKKLKPGTLKDRLLTRI
jgi:predicted PurR-regulated permease PerM